MTPGKRAVPWLGAAFLVLRLAAQAPEDKAPCAGDPAFARMKAAIEADDLDKAEQAFRSRGQREERACAVAFEKDLAKAYEDADKLAEARRTYLEELKDLEGSPAASALVLRSLARIGMQLRDEDAQTEEYLNRSIRIYTELNDRKSQASVLNLIGYFRMQQEHFAPAEKSLLDCVAIASEIADTARVGSCKGSLADLYNHRSEYRKARQYGFEALDISRKSKDDRQTARMVEILGTLYLTLNQAERALEFFQEGLALKEKSHASPNDLAACHQDIGDALAHLNRRPEAVQELEKALALRRPLGMELKTADTLNALAGVQEPTEARKSYQESLEIARSHKDDSLTAANLYELGNLYLHGGDLDAALAAHREALAIGERLDNIADVVSSRSRLGVVLESRNELAEAARVFQSALGPLESLGKQVIDPAQYGKFQETAEILYPHYARVLLRLGQRKEAFAVSERGRGIGLARATRLNAHNFLDKLSAPEREEWIKNSASLSRASNAWAYLAKSGAEPRLLDEARLDYQDQARQVETLRERLLLNSSADSGSEAPVSASIDELAKLPDDRALYLEWRIVDDSWGVADDSSILLFAYSRKDGLSAYELPVKEDALRREVKRWRDAMAARGNVRGVRRVETAGPAVDEPKQAAALYQMLLAPVATMLQSNRFQRLFLVADGPLAEIPFAALIDGEGKRLLERVSITNEVSFEALRTSPSRPAPISHLLVIADPLKAAETRVIEPGGYTFEPLKFARQEAAAISKLDPGSVELEGQAAREARVKQMLCDYEILHFATHGILDSKDGLQSGLLLAAEPRDGAEDGLLQ
ncbi:MAG TPA: CHAT domain-containing tetratricopeptide repeat protein, partial [Bryobacteraceae bacterium]|nr:CHAT domain-containing tetratricopeptide repeat protein [Bryobacteraceae bacterium]